MPHGYCFHPGKENPLQAPHSAGSLFLNCIRGCLAAHICDCKSKERLDHKPVPAPNFITWLLSSLSQSSYQTDLHTCLKHLPLHFPPPQPTKLYSCLTQRPARGCFSRGQSESPSWGEPSWEAPWLHRARTSPHLILLMTSKFYQTDKSSPILRCLQVLCFPGASYQVPLGFYVNNHFFQSQVLSTSSECTLFWPWFLPLLLKWDQCWLFCLFQITKVILPFSGSIRPISSHNFLAGNSACTSDFDPGQLNTALKYITW